jgi:hypothetical protein
MKKSLGSRSWMSLLAVSVLVGWPLGCGSQQDQGDRRDGAVPMSTGGTGVDVDAASGAGGAGVLGGSGGGVETGGVSASGGVRGTGGVVLDGGAQATGGAAGGPGLGTGTGGGPGTSTATGGKLAAGGATSAGGNAVGGKSGTGGLLSTGGKGGGAGAGTGGAATAASTGGKPGTGGVVSSGGAMDGGMFGSGGASVPSGVPGNPEGKCAIPSDAQLEDVSSPTTVVGKGTPDSCSGEAFISAVAKGGIITFDCGPDPRTITLNQPAKVFNDKGPKIVIDGGGKITLNGNGSTRILYMSTCDENQVWTSDHCDNQETPQLTVQNLTFINGNAKNESDGGGAIFASGGRLKILNSRFVNNVCADTGPDLGGGAVRAFQQYQGLPVYVVGSTFGGAEGLGNVGSNGGALSSIGVSWTVLNSIISYNQAIGNGGNPAESGTPGGGSGGGIYNDGDKMTLTICGTRIEYNKVNAYGSAIFFVSNNHTGDIKIDSSVITQNIGGSWYPKYPQISMHEDTPIVVSNSTIQ